MLVLAVATAIATAIPQPAATEPIPRNADGTPAMARTLPCREVGPVRFSVPVSLVGACVPDRVAVGEVVVELDWRATGEVPWSAGVFVHLVRRGGGSVTADHHAVASSFTFEDAPRGVILRDRAGVFLSRPGTWDVWVGLWHAGGDGTRIPPLEGGERGRVHVGTIEVVPR